MKARPSSLYACARNIRYFHKQFTLIGQNTSSRFPRLELDSLLLFLPRLPPTYRASSKECFPTPDRACIIVIYRVRSVCRSPGLVRARCATSVPLWRGTDANAPLHLHRTIPVHISFVHKFVCRSRNRCRNFVVPRAKSHDGSHAVGSSFFFPPFFVVV